ncbi:MAG: protein kinase [Myxococcota bacterium]|nr:protein kinase [Myxococcota bacterium]
MSASDPDSRPTPARGLPVLPREAEPVSPLERVTVAVGTDLEKLRREERAPTHAPGDAAVAAATDPAAGAGPADVRRTAAPVGEVEPSRTRVASDPRAALLDAPTRATDPEEPVAAAAFPDSTGLRPYDVLGAYQILTTLGGGGMAEVYLALATLGAGVEKLVALKTARPAYGPDTRLGALFLNEARVSATLQHPNVVQVFDFGEAAGRPYMAMEYVHGRELHDVLSRVNEGQPLPVDLLVAVLAEVCEALEYVHTQRGLDGAPLNLVHRDVSPSNILITDRGQVKLMDFGVAAGQDDQTGMVVGKKAYMPPEQARGEPPSPRWDVYATGAILGEFLSRSRFGPTPTGGPVEVLADLEEVSRKATAEDPRHRYGTASELGGELRRVGLCLDRPDLGGSIRALFGAELEEGRARIERLVQEGRRRAPRARSGSLPGPLRALSAWRRKIASTRWAMRLAASPRATWTLGWVLVVLVGLAGLQLLRTRRLEQSLVAHLVTADARIDTGRLVGPGGDFALDHLNAALALEPADPRVRSRLEALATTFERLGELALQRGDHAEAAVHLQAALQAAPQRTSAQEKLTAVETAVREHSRKRSRPRAEQ